MSDNNEEKPNNLAAPEEDRSWARSYPQWPDKGPLTEGRRITVMTRKNSYRVNEEVHVVHVHEILEPGHLLYVMGPKPVYGEYVNGKLSTPLPPPDQDPFVPVDYDGRVVPSPAIDYNYEITSYRFVDVGPHQIYWQLGRVRSNTLALEVVRDE